MPPRSDQWLRGAENPCPSRAILEGAAHLERRVALLVPVDCERRTGGYIWGARVALELRELGWAVEEQALPPGHNAFVYVYRGALQVGGTAVPLQRMDERFRALATRQR